MALPNKYEVKKMQRAAKIYKNEYNVQCAANFSEKFCIFAVHCIFVLDWLVN